MKIVSKCTKLLQNFASKIVETVVLTSAHSVILTGFGAQLYCDGFAAPGQGDATKAKNDVKCFFSFCCHPV
jgi:hypothetical protein